MKNSKDIAQLIEKYGLLPVVPCTENKNFPDGISWNKIKENWITDLNQLNEVINSNSFTVTRKDGTTWTKYGITGFGLLTGTKSGIIIIDLDMHTDPNGELINGIANFDKYLEDNNIDKDMVYNTFTVVSPTGGGKHLYYKYDKEVTGTVGVIVGVDIRAKDNQVPLPYTNRYITVDGKEVLKQYEIEKDLPILELPQELETLLTATNDTSNGTTNGTTNGKKKEKMDVVKIFYDGVNKGTRHEVLCRMAGRVANSCNDYAMFNVIVASLGGTMCDPPFDMNNDDDFEEVNGIIDGIWYKHLNTNSNNFPLPYGYNKEEKFLYKLVEQQAEDENGDPVLDEEGNPVKIQKETKIYNGYLNLVGRRINIEDNTTQYILESQELTDYNKIVVDGGTLFGSKCESEIKTLFAQHKGFCNFDVGPTHTKAILKFLNAQDVYKRKNNLMQDTYFSNNIGWVQYNDNKYLCYPNKEEVLDTIECNCNIKKVTKAFDTKGTVEEWIENVLKLVTVSNNGKVMLISTFASLLVNFLDIHENAIIQLEGPTSTGKSGCINGCASVYGKVDNYVQTWQATKNAVVGIFASFGSFPIIFDDLKDVDPKLKKDLPGLFYGFVQGEEKARSNVEGTVRNSRTFNSLLITSGEYPVTNDLKGHEGATARVLVLKGSFLQKSNENATIVNNIYTNSQKYYGTVGLEWCKYLIGLKNNNKIDEIKYIYQTYRDTLITMTNSNLVARKCNTIALLQVTAHILEKFLGQDYFNMDELIAYLLQLVEETTKEADQNDSAFMEVIEELQLPTYKSELDKNGIYMGNKKVGFVRADYSIGNIKYGEALVINTNKLKELLERMEYNGTTITRAWGNRGYVGKNTKNENSTNVRPYGRCTIMLLSKYNELIGSTPVNSLEEVQGEDPYNNDELQQRRNKRREEVDTEVNDVF